MLDEIINGYKCSVVFDQDGNNWVAETKLMPHADRLLHIKCALHADAEMWLRKNVPQWPPGYFK